jgi:hypothetical protein
MRARLSRQRQAGTRPPDWPPAGHTRARSGQAASTHTAPRPEFPSAMCPWPPQHGGLQRYKVTHHWTEQKRLLAGEIDGSGWVPCSLMRTSFRPPVMRVQPTRATASPASPTATTSPFDSSPEVQPCCGAVAPRQALALLRSFSSSFAHPAWLGVCDHRRTLSSVADVKPGSSGLSSGARLAERDSVEVLFRDPERSLQAEHRE